MPGRSTVPGSVHCRAMIVRRATAADLPGILGLLFDDRATPSNELDPGAPCYAEALREMQASDENGTYVAEAEGRLVGTFMLTFIRHLMRQGSLVAQIEAARVDALVRTRGHTAEMMRLDFEEARGRDCTREQRPRTHSRTADH